MAGNGEERRKGAGTILWATVGRVILWSRVICVCRENMWQWATFYILHGNGHGDATRARSATPDGYLLGRRHAGVLWRSRAADSFPSK
jgi:hypothetical protein